MKTDRRHELKQNELADVLGRWIAVVNPYSRIIVGVVILGCVASGYWTYSKYQARLSTEEAWAKYFLEGIKIDGSSGQPDVDFDALGELADDNADQPVGQWALLSSADHRLVRGVQLLLQYRGWDKGQEELSKAIQEYTNVLKALDTINDPRRGKLPRQRAIFGLARAHESRGDLDKAKEQYEKLVETDGPFSRVAQKRIAAIGTPATKKFYSELEATVESQSDPLDTRIDPKLLEKLREKIDIFQPPGPSGGEDPGPASIELPIPSANPASEKKPAAKTTDESKPEDPAPAPKSEDPAPVSKNPVPQPKNPAKKQPSK